MRLWNLSNFDELEQPVLVAQPPTAALGTPLRRSRGPSTASSLRFAVRVAALTAISCTIMATGSSPILVVPQSAAQVASNVNESRPPLDVIFGGRFAGDWTRAKEDALLARAAEKIARPSEQDLLNLIQSSQQESLSDDVPRLSDDEVLRIIRRKA